MKNSSAYKNFYEIQADEKSSAKSRKLKIVSEDKKQFINILKEKFDEQKFISLIKNIFNEFTVKIRDRSVPKNFSQNIKEIKLLGQYEDQKGKKISSFIVHLNKETSLEKARTKQRNCIARHLKNKARSWGFGGFCIS